MPRLSSTLRLGDVAPDFELREAVSGSSVSLASADRRGARYPFPLLCNHGRAVIKRYGVWHPIGIDAFNVSRPASFLVDAGSRRIRYSFVGESQFERAPLTHLLAAAQP